ncbi:unnamed protein product [Mucor hiemalis]
MSDTETISKFQAFEEYNFEKDEKFKSGVASLLNNKQDNEAELLEKAKLFYYTNSNSDLSIHSNLKAYKDWKESNQIPSAKIKKTEEENAEKPPRFSFQELVDMIEKGIEIPGIKQIPNVLNEGKPSEAKMTARPKPWEIKNSENETKQEF